MSGELRSSGAIQGEIDLKKNLIDDVDTGLKTALDSYKQRKQDALAIVNKETGKVENQPYSTGGKVFVADPGMTVDKPAAVRELEVASTGERQVLAEIAKLQAEIKRLEEEKRQADAREAAQGIIDPLMADCRIGKGFEACRNELDAQRKGLGEVLFDRYLKEYERLLAETADTYIRNYIRDSETGAFAKIFIEIYLSSITDKRLRDAVYDRRGEMHKHLDSLAEKYEAEARSISKLDGHPNSKPNIRNAEAWGIVEKKLKAEAKQKESENRVRLRASMISYMADGGTVIAVDTDFGLYKDRIQGFNPFEWVVLDSYLVTLAGELKSVGEGKKELDKAQGQLDLREAIMKLTFEPPVKREILLRQIEEYRDRLVMMRAKAALGFAAKIAGTFGPLVGGAAIMGAINPDNNTVNVGAGLLAAIPGGIMLTMDVIKFFRKGQLRSLERSLNVQRFRDTAIGALGKEFTSDEVKKMFRLSRGNIEGLRQELNTAVETGTGTLARI